jgi:hypothetical protein
MIKTRNTQFDGNAGFRFEHTKYFYGTKIKSSFEILLIFTRIENIIKKVH